LKTSILRKSAVQQFAEWLVISNLRSNLSKESGGGDGGGTGTVATSSDSGVFTPTYGGDTRKRKKDLDNFLKKEEDSSEISVLTGVKPTTTELKPNVSLQETVPSQSTLTEAAGRDYGPQDETMTEEEKKLISEPRVRLTPVNDRAWEGKPTGTRQLSHSKTGTLGESIAHRFLIDQGHKDVQFLNVGRGNYPVDLIAGDLLVEVKAGLSLNQPDSQKWRVTIGEQGEEETNWLKDASDEAKEEWGHRKMDAIMERKQHVFRELGKKRKPVTISLILNLDTNIADIYWFDGFHRLIGWNSPQAREGYVGSYKYEE